MSCCSKIMAQKHGQNFNLKTEVQLFFMRVQIFLIGCTVGPMHMLYTNPRISSIDYFRYYLELLVFMCFGTCTFANSIENH